MTTQVSKEYRSRNFYTNYYAYKEFSWYNHTHITYETLQELKRSLDLDTCVDPQILACLTSKDGKIIYGLNSRKSHPMQKRFALNEFKIFMHAEIHCLVQAVRCKNFSIPGSTIEVFRWSKVSHSPQLSFPCDGCFKALKESKVESVTYFDEEGFVRKLEFCKCV